MHTVSKTIPVGLLCVQTNKPTEAFQSQASRKQAQNGSKTMSPPLTAISVLSGDYTIPRTTANDKQPVTSY